MFKEGFVSGDVLGVSYAASKDLGPEFNANLSRVFDLAQWFGCLYMGSMISSLDALGPKTSCDVFEKHVAKLAAAVSAEIDASGVSPIMKKTLTKLQVRALTTLRGTVAQPACTKGGMIDVKALKARLLGVQGSLCVALATPQGVTGTLPPAKPLVLEDTKAVTVAVTGTVINGNASGTIKDLNVPAWYMFKYAFGGKDRTYKHNIIVRKPADRLLNGAKMALTLDAKTGDVLTVAGVAVAATKPVAPMAGTKGVLLKPQEGTKPVAKPGKPGGVQGPTPLPTPQGTAAQLASQQQALARLPAGTLARTKMQGQVELSKTVLAVDVAKAAETRAAAAKNAAAKARVPAAVAAANKKYDLVVKAAGDARREAAAATITARAAQVATVLGTAQRLVQQVSAARVKTEAAAQRAVAAAK